MALVEDLKTWTPPPPTEAKDVPWADILTVDMSLYDAPSGRAELVKVVNTALRRNGFFYLINHGISREHIQQQFSLSHATFDQVSLAEKEQHLAPILEKGSFRGYKLQRFWEIGNGVRDRIEAYNLDLHDLEPPESHPALLRPYLDDIRNFLVEVRTQVLKRVLSLMDGALELPEDTLWKLHDRDGQSGKDVLKYMLYEPMSSSEAQKTNNVYLTEHTDFGTVTTLFSQPVAGLQVLGSDGSWKWVKHRENAILINIGDNITFLSGGIFKAAMHRVVRPPLDQVHLQRVGLFHFSRAFGGTSSLPLSQSPVVQREGKVMFEPGAHVPTTDEWERIRTSRYGVEK